MLSKNACPRLLLSLLVVLLLAAGVPAQDPGKMGVKDKQRLKEYEGFLGQLANPDSIKRSLAVQGLGRVGMPEAAPALVDFAIRENYAYLARQAAETAVGLDATGTLERTLKMVGKGKNGSARTRRNLIILLRECQDESAWNSIVEDFGDTENEEVFIELLRAVAARKIEKGYGRVKSALGAKKMEIRINAAIAAGLIGSPEFVPALLQGLETTDQFYCKFAAQALTAIDDPSIFPQVVGRLGSASGESGESKAKALEGTALVEHVEKLVGILAASRSREYREAAAIALGRLGSRERGVQETLLNRMLRDPDREVRGACWHALTRLATDEIKPQVLKRLNQKKPEQLKYMFHMVGTLKLTEGTGQLLKYMINEKDKILRHAAAINYWKAADAKTISAFERRIEASSGQFLERGVEALGFRKNVQGFKFLLRMLKVLRDGSKEEYVVEKALERITGHFFGPDPAIWKKWFKKNDKFFTPKQAELERNKWREDFDKANEGFRQTEETEYSVQLGLEFLARHQHPDGRFDPQRFYKMCKDRPECKREGARLEFDPVGTTALGALAFMGAGYSPTEGKYKDVLARALEYLLARQQANGNFLSNDLVGGYHRPVGTQAFAEAYVLGGREEFGWACQRGIDFLTTIQNKLGGWRYRVKIETTDTSCMSWNLFAAKAAQKAGLEVKEIVFAGCYNIMDMYSEDVGMKGPREFFIDIDPEYGYEVGRNTTYEFETGYQNPKWDTKYATVPLGIMCRIFMGWRRSHPFCIGSANKILADMMEPIPKKENWDLYRSKREYPTYAWYYGTLAMHQMGGRYFRDWNERIRKVIPGTQQKTGCMRGSWPIWNHDSINGRVVTTCLGVLTLETYYRYLPVLAD